MASDTKQRLALGGSDVYVPADVVAGAIVLACADVVSYLPEVSVFGRFLVTVPVLCFLPGYSLLTYLFPRNAEGGYESGETTKLARSTSSWPERSSLGTLERFGLSVGVSIALLPLLGIALGTTVGISRSTVLGSLSVVVLAGLLGGTIRRWRLPKSRRYEPPIGRWAGAARAAVVADTWPRRVLNLSLLVLVVTAVGVFGFAVVTPSGAESYTDLMVLSEDENGSLVASGYPEDITAGDGEPLTLRVANEENREATYTAVVELHRIDPGGDAISERERLGRTTQTIPDGEVWYEPHTVSPTMVGEDLRLTYLLYRGEVTGTPDPDDAYRRAHVWIDVSSPES